jgi:release factor glutamine methyltransferase
MPETRAALADATRRLAAAGVATPRVDAELLLAAALDVPRGRLLTREVLPAAAAARFEAFLSRRAAREPLQHIVGTAPFRRVELAVGAGVFVPRPETELLVDAVLPHLLRIAHPVAVDLCAGSGALAVAIADEVPGARVVALESAPAALPWLHRNGLPRGVEVLAGDVREDTVLAGLRGAADAVVANPPYVPDGVAVDPEVRADPPAAVFAGSDGLALLPAVIARAAELLRPGGMFAVEHGDSHGSAVPDMLAADGRWQDIGDHRDLAGRPRYVTAVRRS